MPGIENVTELNARCAIPDQLGFRLDPGGLVVAEITNPLATATIALQGAHVMGWTPRGTDPVIWLSPATPLAPGRPIRGGVPVCWPWFGPHPSGGDLPVHGFARILPWSVASIDALPDGATHLVLRLEVSAGARPDWPCPIDVEVRIVIGAALEIDLLTRNPGSDGFILGEALHAYLRVGDVRRVAIHGLGGCTYIDKVAAGARKRQGGPITIAGEVDRVFVNTTADCVIDDPTWHRSIRVAKEGSRSTVIWNPWVEGTARADDLEDDGYLGMVCVESANAADDVVTLAPGGEHRLRVRYSLERSMSPSWAARPPHLPRPRSKHPG